MDPLDIFKESNFFPEFSNQIVSVMEAINDLSNNSIHYYNLNISDINSSVTSSPTKKYHHITLRRDNQSPLINSLTPNDVLLLLPMILIYNLYLMNLLQLVLEVLK